MEVFIARWSTEDPSTRHRRFERPLRAEPRCSILSHERSRGETSPSAGETLRSSTSRQVIPIFGLCLTYSGRAICVQ